MRNDIEMVEHGSFLYNKAGLLSMLNLQNEIKPRSVQQRSTTALMGRVGFFFPFFNFRLFVVSCKIRTIVINNTHVIFCTYAALHRQLGACAKREDR